MVVNSRRVLVAALALLLVSLAAIAPYAGLKPAQAASQAIRVGYFANITHAQAVLGFGAGIFASELPGITVKGTVFNAGGDEINAMFAGALDMGYIGPGPAINGYIKSQGAVVIVAGAATGGAVLVARAGTHITSVKDLAGKTVAVPQLGNTQDIELRALLNDAGLKPTQSGGNVHIIAVNNADTLSLFLKGDLDAALEPEPWGSRLIQEDKATLVLDASQIYGGTLPVTVVVASASFLKAHPDLVVKFLRVHDMLTRRLELNKTGSLAILNAQIKALTGKALNNDELSTSLARTTFSDNLRPSDFTRFAAFSVTAGYLKKGANLSGLIDSWPMTHLLDKSIK